MAESRDERRRRLKAEERKRQEEVDRLLEEPRPPLFEAPPTGTIVDSSVGVGPPPARKPDAGEDG